MDIAEDGISRGHLHKLLQMGLIEKVSRGVYQAADADIGVNHSLVTASKKEPTGVVCLLSALRFHDLTSKNPHEVWMAIDGKARLPKAHEQGVRFFCFFEATLHYGVSIHQLECVPVLVYDPAKTVADCFEFRNEIGLDIALEALRDCWRQRKATMDEIWQAAKICRVARGKRS